MIIEFFYAEDNEILLQRKFPPITTSRRVMFTTEAEFLLYFVYHIRQSRREGETGGTLVSFLRHDDDLIFFYSQKDAVSLWACVLEMSLLVSTVMNSMMELKAIA